MLAASLLLTLTLAEGLIRWLAPHFAPASQFRLDWQAGHPRGPVNQQVLLHKPGGAFSIRVRFGPDGFREPHRLDSFQPCDWTLIGDSFAFGWGVDQPLGDVIAETLAQDIADIALPGTDLRQQRGVLGDAKAAGLPAHRAIIVVSVENDLFDYAAFPARATSQGNIRLRTLARRHLALYHLLADRIHASERLRGFARKAGLLATPLPYRAATDDEIDSSLAQLDALAQGFDQVLVVSHLPFDGPWQEFSSRWQAALEQWSRSSQRDYLLIPLTAPDFFQTDPHWNAVGQRKVADQIAAKIDSLPDCKQHP